MRWIRVTLTALDTPASIKELAGLTSKYANVAYFKIYAEAGNNDDATNDVARIGGSDVDRVVAGGVKGIPLPVGTTTNFDPVGAAGVYDFSKLYLTGAVGDVFQIGYVII